MHSNFTQRISAFALFFFLFFSYFAHSQVFWTEDFGTGCNTGTVANGFVTGNGTWTVDNTIGFNETYANEWYISGHTSNTGSGNCAGDCAAGTNQTLHIGNVEVIGVGLTAEQGSYLTGFYCATLTYCSETHKRAESPLINCLGKSTITLDFLYYEGGDPGNVNGDATLWYFDGTTWSQLDPLPKTNNSNCSATIYGVWTPYSVALPASADNNPGIKLGFRWDNDDSGVGTDPSTAFDDLELSVPGGGTPPVAAFTASDTVICEGDSIDFTDLSTNSPTSWQWTFNGGNPGSSTLQNPTDISYSLAGVYDVTLTATNADGSDVEIKFGYITVNACGGTLVADFTASDTVICEGDAIDFTDLSTGTPTSWQWIFTGGSPLTSNVQNPTGIVYPTAGNYTVALYVTNATEADTLINVSYITVNVCGTAPVANFQASANTICANDAVDFTDLSTNAPTAWNWTFFGATPPTSTAQNPTGIVYPNAGAYNVQLIVSNADGSDTLLFTNYISVNNCVPPVANFVASDTSLCVGDSISFFNLSTNNPTSYQWTFFGATPPVSSLANPTGIFYNTPGVYTVQLIAINSAGSDTLVLTNYITVDACIPPVAGFSATQTTICEGFCIDFTDVSTGTPTSWLWLFPGSNTTSSGQQNPTNVCYSDSGTYNVTLIVQNAYGMDTLLQTAYITVDTCPKPIVRFIASDTSFCSGNCINFTDLSDNVDATTTWRWLFPGGDPAEDTIQHPTVCYPEEGVYDVILIETNQYGTDTLIISQYISVINVPGSYVSNDTAIYFGGFAQLFAGGGVNYHWTSQVPGSTFFPSDSVSNPIVTPFSSPPEEVYTYYVEITDSTTGCKTTKQVQVEILHFDNLFVPNSFRPSSSGANSTVGVYATNVKTLEFCVYDKWGEKVFESRSACPDTGPCDPSGWDGKYKGVECEMGTYVYTVFLITNSGAIYHKNGNITLIR